MTFDEKLRHAEHLREMPLTTSTVRELDRIEQQLLDHDPTCELERAEKARYLAWFLKSALPDVREFREPADELELLMGQIETEMRKAKGAVKDCS